MTMNLKHYLISVIFSVLLTPIVQGQQFSNYFFNDTTSHTKGKVSITFLGASTLLINDGEVQFIIDGFFSRPERNKVLFSKISTNESIVNEAIKKYNLTNLNSIFV